MQKTIGATLLVAGTCIGSGMIALPMVLATIGLIPSILLMLFIWYVMYFTSLINLELNLQAGRGISLGALGKLYSGKGAELIGTLSLKLLSYSLLAVFIYGGSSILHELLVSKMDLHYSFNAIATVYALCAIIMLLFPIQIIDYANRILFIGLLAIVALLLTGLSFSINWSNLPLFSNQVSNVSIWAALIPVVFTSFGFQVIFHTLTNYCHKNVNMLKQAFFWGSLIPALIYILWTCSILSVVFHDNPSFYQNMIEGKIEIGALIRVLSDIAKWGSIQLLVWLISILAITTSVLGVGVGLCETLNIMTSQPVPNSRLRSLLAAVLTILPAYLVVIFVPNAFIAVLGFAGMILAVIAILLPIYLYRSINKQRLHYPELRSNWLIYLSLCIGIGIILCELYNMLST